MGDPDRGHPYRLGRFVRSLRTAATVSRQWGGCGRRSSRGRSGHGNLGTSIRSCEFGGCEVVGWAVRQVLLSCGSFGTAYWRSSTYCLLDGVARVTREPDHVPIHLDVQHPRPWLLPALHAEQPPARSYANPARAEVGHPGDARKCPVPCHRQRVHDPDRPVGRPSGCTWSCCGASGMPSSSFSTVPSACSASCERSCVSGW